MHMHSNVFRRSRLVQFHSTLNAEFHSQLARSRIYFPLYWKELCNFLRIRQIDTELAMEAQPHLIWFTQEYASHKKDYKCLEITSLRLICSTNIFPVEQFLSCAPTLRVRACWARMQWMFSYLFMNFPMRHCIADMLKLVESRIILLNYLSIFNAIKL